MDLACLPQENLNEGKKEAAVELMTPSEGESRDGDVLCIS